MSLLRRGRPAPPLPKHPYKGSAILYGSMAVILVVVAALTGADVLRALLVAALFFVAATGWSWFRFRQRIRERDAQDRESPTARGDANGRRKEGS
jgi:hypothetical protein